jgi:hypothetical protein
MNGSPPTFPWPSVPAKQTAITNLLAVEPWLNQSATVMHTRLMRLWAAQPAAFPPGNDADIYYLNFNWPYV